MELSLQIRPRIYRFLTIWRKMNIITKYTQFSCAKSQVMENYGSGIISQNTKPNLDHSHLEFHFNQIRHTLERLYLTNFLIFYSCFFPSKKWLWGETTIPT